MKYNKINLKWYVAVSSVLKTLSSSEARLKILKLLYIDNLSMVEIYKKSKLPYSSISVGLANLDQMGLLKVVNNKFALNNLGKIYFTILLEFTSVIKFLKDFSKFWKDHQVDSIDEDALNHLASLKESVIIESTPIDIFKTYNVFKENMDEVNIVKSIFPYLHPDFPILFNDLIQKEVNVKLLFPKSLSHHFLKLWDLEIPNEELDNNLLEVRSVEDNINLALTVTDKFLYLGICKSDGNYNHNHILFSKSNDAINWGNKLFNKYYNESSKLFLH
ncbi:helix-turn-helix transcriptional regulator [Methanobrevibacter filiformis]|uniref:Methanogenesis regulatory protein FilR1 middle domain-containing protein n=1 Tax=Methanobrevibacter filiformis TaxID=55758 RepID=A0A166EBE4_9EURY|nr:transcriptional regulator FilR1 domain-containing protein [Methanobrevibacter filiformis]KZX16473.1 hypothetical protein MBFIL_05150 [Methanobrevibacter filiformis]